MVATGLATVVTLLVAAWPDLALGTSTDEVVTVTAASTAAAAVVVAVQLSVVGLFAASLRKLAAPIAAA
jgi:hypothetical protein